MKEYTLYIYEVYCELIYILDSKMIFGQRKRKSNLTHLDG